MTRRPDQQTTKNGRTTLLNLSYEYNRLGSAGNLNGKTGHLTKIIDNLNNAKNREYEFDAVGRLTKAKGGLAAGAGGGSADWTQAYTYDRYGNRTSVTAAGTAADSSPIPLDGLPNLAYDATSNRITTTGFQYDAAGNQTSGFSADGTPLNFEYDAANRIQIIKRQSDGSLVQAFQYGSTNARLIDYDATAGLNKFYASVGGTTLAEYIEYAQFVFTWTKTYTYLGSTQLATVTPNGSGGEYVEFNHPDRLGTRLQTNQSGGTAYEQVTLPFGTALNAESTVQNNNKRFTSYDRSNATGLDYAINRTYDSKQGRFTQIDPIGMSAVSLAAPQTLNMYAYCGNDPINFTDPSGLFWGTLFRWLARIFGFISRNRRAIAAIVSVALVVAPQGFRRIAGPILGILSGVSDLLGSGFAGAIGVEIGNSVNRILNAVLVGVGAIVNSFAQRKDKRKPGAKTKAFCKQIEPYINAARGIFDEAFRESFNGNAVEEQGGHVQWDSKGNGEYRQYERVPNTPSYTLDGFKEWAGQVSPNIRETGHEAKVRLTYHTHPHGEGDFLGWEDGVAVFAKDANFPSRGDRGVSKELGIAGVIVSSTSIAVYGPQGRRCRFNR